MMKLNEDAQDGGLQIHWDALKTMLLHPDKETRETGAVVAVGQGHYKHLLGAFEMHLDKLRQTKKPSNYKPLQAGSREPLATNAPVSLFMGSSLKSRRKILATILFFCF